MSWLKDVIVDIVVTIVIVATIFTQHPILTWIIWGYTGLLLIAKLLVLLGGDTLNMTKKAKTEAPNWFSHLLYATNTGVLLYIQWWYLGGCWAVVWLLSYLTQRKIDQGS